MRSHKKRGFTLIEMLIVISIIVVLMTLVLTAMGTARKKANALACQSQIRQVVMVLKSYANDYGDYPREDGKAFITWLYFVGKLTDTKYLKCPGEGAAKDVAPKINELFVVRGGVESIDDIKGQFRRYGYWPANTISYAGAYNDKEAARTDARWLLERMLVPTPDDLRERMASGGEWGDSYVPLVSDDNDLPKNHEEVINIGFADGNPRPINSPEEWDNTKLPFAALTSK